MAEMEMNTRMERIWKALGSVDLAVVLLLLLVGDTAVGSLALRFGDNPFRSFNDSGLIDWVQTYGLHDLPETWWFFLLLPLLFLLALNTFVCTTLRVAAIVKARSHAGGPGLLFKLSPHAMHYALILILLGFLASTLFARVLPNNPLVPGKSMRLYPSEFSLMLEALRVDYYRGGRLPDAWLKRALDARAELRFTDGAGTVVHRDEVSINHPARFQGFSIHLKDFGPQIEGGGMSRQPYVNLIIKKDPALTLYFAGTALFVAGLVVYLVEWFRTRKRKDER